MSSIYEKVFIEKKWRSQNFDYICLKSSASHQEKNQLHHYCKRYLSHLAFYWLFEGFKFKEIRISIK